MVANVFFTFGSGGHSTEMLLMIQNANLANKNIHPSFVITEDDELICNKLKESFGKIRYDLLKLRRGRKVGQSYLTSVLTVILSLFQAFMIVIKKKPRLLITNGPAISVIMCLAIRVLQVSTLGLLYKCDIIYVESFCRTKTLSLSGKLIYQMRLANEFYVQWPKLTEDYPRAIYYGLLV